MSDEVVFDWNENNVCLNDKVQTCVTLKKSHGNIGWASRDGKWYSSCGFNLKGGTCQGMGSGVISDGKSFATELEAKKSAWIELYNVLVKIQDHADAPALAEMVKKMIDGEEQPELF